MITIVDYGIGNLGSILNMLKWIKVEGEIRSDEEGIKNAKKLLLPGVGSFDAAMDRLSKSHLVELLNRKVIYEKTPIMGICLGMQLLMQRSEEGKMKGLGWINGEAKKFRFDDKALKVPHMGWNDVVLKKPSHPITKGVEGSKFYFVHSYYVKAENQDDVLLSTQYGHFFDSGVARDNIYGLQFHPEKSHKYGMNILKNFAKA